MDVMEGDMWYSAECSSWITFVYPFFCSFVFACLANCPYLLFGSLTQLFQLFCCAPHNDMDDSHKESIRSGFGDDVEVSCNLVHHGAAGCSSSHSLLYLKNKDILVFPSHGIVNLATTIDTTNTMRNVHHTLRSSSSNNNNKEKVIITCCANVQDYNNNNDHDNSSDDIACGFSNGMLTLWWSPDDDVVDDDDTRSNNSLVFTQENIVTPPPETTTTVVSFTDIAAMTHIPTTHTTSTSTATPTIHSPFLVLVVTATCTGIHLYSRYQNHPLHTTHSQSTATTHWIRQGPSSAATTGAVTTVLLKKLQHTTTTTTTTTSSSSTAPLLLFTGSAAPRANRIRVFSLLIASPSSSSDRHPNDTPTTTAAPLWDICYQGHLLGHQDWITCMSWTTMVLTNTNTNASSARSSSYLLASGSHDAKIRLWKFIHSSTNDDSSTNEMMDKTTTNFDTNEFLLDDDEVDDDDEEARLIVNHSSSQSKIAVTLEAILVGHDDIVTSVSWQQQQNDTTATTNILLSSSMDRSILIWSLLQEEEDDSSSSCWIPQSRIGSAGGILGASIGSSLLGFVDATWIDNNRTIVGHGYGGSLYFWKNDTEDDNCWKAQPPLTGHFRSVNDLSWEPTRGDYLLTVSSDQTCRLLAPLVVCSTTSWREVGRPQIHGYDINAIACIGEGKGELYGRFISGSSEKQLRVFDTPCATIRLLDQITSLTTTTTTPVSSHLLDNGRVEKAFLPTLGLTNKAEDETAVATTPYSSTATTTTTEKEEDETDTSTTTTTNTNTNIADILPRERELGMSTVWPEVTQLFGHSSDLICIASTVSCCKSSSSNRSTEVIVASSCKARDAEQACIRLWNVNLRSCLGVLKGGHQSTVVALGFSIDERYLASCGKDRRICIWQKKSTSTMDDDDDSLYQLAVFKSMAHKRIIWTCNWCPQNSSILATGSRDGFVKIWKVDTNNGVPEINIIHLFEPMAATVKKQQQQQQHGKQQQHTNMIEPVTALSFSPTTAGGVDAILAIGLESGLIELWSIVFNDDTNAPCCQILHIVNESDCHLGAIKKIEWRPEEQGKHDSSSTTVQLTFATCGLDHGVRIFDLHLPVLSN